jgi:hypothetical protein
VKPKLKVVEGTEEPKPIKRKSSDGNGWFLQPRVKDDIYDYGLLDFRVHYLDAHDHGIVFHQDFKARCERAAMKLVEDWLEVCRIRYSDNIRVTSLHQLSGFVLWRKLKLVHLWG